MAIFTLLHSTPGHFQPRNSITMSMTKSYSQFLKLSNDGDITSKALDFRSTWSPITRICNTFQRPKSSCIDKHVGPNTFPDSIHRTTAQYSLPSNWHRPSELLPYQSQSFVDLSSWMLKGSIPTSGLNSEMIPFPQNTLTISQTPSGPSIMMVYYDTSDASMFRTPAISDCVFFSTRMTIRLQDISVRRRLYIKSVCNTIGPDFQSMSKTTANHAQLVPTPNLCATTLTDFSSNFRFPRSLGIPYPWIS